jgi:type IV secretory pathway VirB10-like protein
MSGSDGRSAAPAWVRLAIGTGLLGVVLLALFFPLLFPEEKSLEQHERQRRAASLAEPLDRPPPDEPAPGSPETLPPAGLGEGGQQIGTTRATARARRRPAVPSGGIGATAASAGGGGGGYGQDGGGGAGQDRADRDPAVAVEMERLRRLASASQGGGSGGAPGSAPDPASLQGQAAGALQVEGVVQVGQGGDADYTIGANRKIPCTPVEKHITALGGLVTCVTPAWVRGDSQRLGLLPPGTVFRGQVKAGMLDGAEVIGVHHTSFVTPGDRFLGRLTGFGTELMGEAGLAAKTRSFFWQNAGQVAVWSLVQGLGGALPYALGALGGADTIASLNLGGATNNLGQLAMQANPLKKPQGERAGGIPAFVAVAQDLDFKAACRARRRVNPYACPEM